jgi:hypothetical protein
MAATVEISIPDMLLKALGAEPAWRKAKRCRKSGKV